MGDVSQIKKENGRMLSFKTIVALYVLNILTDINKGLSISDIKGFMGFKGQELGNIILRLKKVGIVDVRSNRNYLNADLNSFTLYDLVMEIDGNLMLGPHIDLNYSLPHMKDNSNIVYVNQLLHDAVSKIMKGIRLGELISKNKSLYQSKVMYGMLDYNLKSVKTS